MTVVYSVYVVLVCRPEKRTLKMQDWIYRERACI